MGRTDFDVLTQSFATLPNCGLRDAPFVCRLTERVTYSGAVPDRLRDAPLVCRLTERVTYSGAVPDRWGTTIKRFCGLDHSFLIYIVEDAIMQFRNNSLSNKDMKNL